jgi:hypothetical protein
MKQTHLDHIEHDPDAQIVHAVNSQLVEALFGDEGCLRALLFDKSSWIINVLYTHGARDIAPVLRTSSTLHKGKLYDHRTVRDDNVQSIDDTVPLASSVSGHCVLSGRPIWLGKTDLGLRQEGFGEKYYRRFSLVDVNTAGYKIPKAEIAFPITDQHLNVTTTLGVLNLELFGNNPADSDEYIAAVPRESINELLFDLLHVHSGFLRVAVDMLDLEPSRGGPMNTRGAAPEWIDTCIDNINGLHRAAIDLFILRNSKNIKHVVGALQEANDQLSGSSSGGYSNNA